MYFFAFFIPKYNSEAPGMIGRHMNGKIEESENSFIDKSTTAFNRRTDSSQSSPNSVKSTNGEKVAIEYYNEIFKSV